MSYQKKMYTTDKDLFVVGQHDVEFLGFMLNSLTRIKNNDTLFLKIYKDRRKEIFLDLHSKVIGYDVSYIIFESYPTYDILTLTDERTINFINSLTLDSTDKLEDFIRQISGECKRSLIRGLLKSFYYGDKYIKSNDLPPTLVKLLLPLINESCENVINVERVGNGIANIVINTYGPNLHMLDYIIDFK